MSVKIKLVPSLSGKTQDVIVQGEFNIGRLLEQRPNANHIIAPIGVSGFKQVLREVLRKDVPSEEVGDWDSTLIEYVKLCVLEELGVQLHPIVTEGGQIDPQAFAGGFEIVEDISPSDEETA